MIISQVTKKQGFGFSLENTFLVNPYGGWGLDWGDRGWGSIIAYSFYQYLSTFSIQTTTESICSISKELLIEENIS